MFTKYRETLFYLEQRFLQEGFDKNTLRLLDGGMSLDEFEGVKGEFEDKDAPVRLLLATDAASEGLNLQEQCRWLIHYDVPWLPSNRQQRNRRVSRHGQDRLRELQDHSRDQEIDRLARAAGSPKSSAPMTRATAGPGTTAGKTPWPCWGMKSDCRAILGAAN
jgi:superfamily II DNA/RNA helicase